MGSPFFKADFSYGAEFSCLGSERNGIKLRQGAPLGVSGSFVYREKKRVASSLLSSAPAFRINKGRIVWVHSEWWCWYEDRKKMGYFGGQIDDFPFSLVLKFVCV